MALSGTIPKSLGSGYKLSIEWSATQSIANNTSTITAKLYWQSTSSAYYVNSSKARQAKIIINGQTIDPIPTPTAQLSGTQKKLLATMVYTTAHNSDGTKTCGIGGTFDLSGISLSGTDYGTVSLSDTVTLNTIPRASTISSSTDWNPPLAFPISVTRANSNFTHNAKIYVKRKSVSSWTFIKTFEDFGTSVGGGFEDSEIEKVFTTLATDSSGDLRIVLETYNGSTLIGTNDYDDSSGSLQKGEVVVKYSSKISNDANWNIGESKHIDIARNHWDYTHVAKFYVNGTWVHTSPTVEFSYDWNPTQSELDVMYTQTKNASSEDTTIELYTYYNGIQVDKVKNAFGSAKVINSNPTFGTGYTYADTNATTKGITGNDQYIIQNNSTVQVTLPTSANATGVNKADIVSYTATLNGVSITKNYSSTTALTFDFGKVNVSSNATLSVKAIDSRGLSTTTTKTISILPWTAPTVNTTVKRANGFETTTTVTLNGSFSGLNVGGANKNTIVSMSYRYKENTPTATFPSAFTNLTFTAPTGTTYAATNTAIELDNTKGYVFEVRTTDKLGSTTVSKTVVVGKPILFIDTDKSSIGMNMFPVNSNSLEVQGNIYSNGVDVQRSLLVPRTVPSMQNSWTTYFGTAYCKTFDGWVMVMGMAQGTMPKDTSGVQQDVTIFTLPTGCTPAVSNQIFYCQVRGGGTMRVDVNMDGRVIVKGGVESQTYANWVCLNGIVFYAG